MSGCIEAAKSSGRRAHPNQGRSAPLDDRAPDDEVSVGGAPPASVGATSVVRRRFDRLQGKWDRPDARGEA